ncbi:hypothetical protein BGX38DRAFT_1147957 [Terfezia claveryi]|nr:hypothetical protein BGX38DRAFT_1147957 [Terfezia claveryi]
MNRQLTALQGRSAILAPALFQLATLLHQDLYLDAFRVSRLIKMTGPLSERPKHHSLQSFTRELFRSRAYKRLNSRRAGAGSSAESIYSKSSSATKGDRWSMLSDISLGALAISEISVLELPICGSDLYDSQPYDLAEEATSARRPNGIHAQRRGVLPWPSRGRIHTAIRTNDEFVLRTLITLGADLEEKDIHL